MAHEAMRAAVSTARDIDGTVVELPGDDDMHKIRVRIKGFIQFGHSKLIRDHGFLISDMSRVEDDIVLFI